MMRMGRVKERIERDYRCTELFVSAVVNKCNISVSQRLSTVDNGVIYFIEATLKSM